MGRRHSVRERLAQDDGGANAERKIYICWPPQVADGTWEADEAQNVWVKHLFRQLTSIPQDSSGTPVTTVTLELDAGVQIETEQRARRESVTDFVFIATAPHIGRHLQLIAGEQQSDLEWALALQKQGDDSAPRIWFVPLEQLEPMWFKFRSRGGPETTINEFIWHIPFSSLVLEGKWGEQGHVIDGIQYYPFDPNEVVKVRTSFLVHGSGACRVCGNTAN